MIEQINATGYGLTHGIHTRIDEKVEAGPARDPAPATSTSTATSSVRWSACSRSAGTACPAPAPRPAGRSICIGWCRSEKPPELHGETVPVAFEALKALQAALPDAARAHRRPAQPAADPDPALSGGLAIERQAAAARADRRGQSALVRAAWHGRLPGRHPAAAARAAGRRLGHQATGPGPGHGPRPPPRAHHRPPGHRLRAGSGRRRHRGPAVRRARPRRPTRCGAIWPHATGDDRPADPGHAPTVATTCTGWWSRRSPASTPPPPAATPR